MNTEESKPAKVGLLRRTHRYVHGRIMAMLAEETSPSRLGFAIAIGVVFGCSPFFGLQLVLALAVAWPLRLNKIAVALGTQISFPPFIPLIVFGGANLGELMLHQRTLPLTFDELRAVAPEELASRFFVAWTVGGLTLGAILGAILGVLTAVLVRWRQAKKAVA